MFLGANMARRSSFLTAIKQSARAAERARKQRLARETKLAKESERAQKLYLKSLEQQAKADAKERAQFKTAS